MRRLMRNLAESFSIDKNQDISTFSGKEEFNNSRINFFNYSIDSISTNKVENKKNFYYFPINLILIIIEWLLRYKESKEIDKLIIVFNKKNNLMSQSIKFNNFKSINSLKEKLSNFLPEKDTMSDNRISISLIHEEIVQSRLMFKFTKKYFYFGVEDLYFSHFSINLTKNLNLFLNKIFKNNEVSEEQNLLFKEWQIKNKIDILKCCRCGSNLSEMKKQRGDNIYLVPCISDKKNKLFICDLCLGGW